jgi:hypothetical protein
MKALILGASGSLGRALALEEAKQKTDLVLVASEPRDVEAMKSDLSLKFGIQVEIATLDLSSAKLVASLPLNADRYYFPIGSTLDNDQIGIDSSSIEKLFSINLLCVSQLISALASNSANKTVEVIGFGSIAETRGRSNNSYGKTNIKPYLFQIGYMKSQLSFGKKMLFPAAEPQAIAKLSIQYLNTKKPGIYYAPGFWYWICFALKLVPWPIYRKLKF